MNKFVCINKLIFDQVDNFLLVDQWASLASSTPTATLSDITLGVLYSVLPPGFEK